MGKVRLKSRAAGLAALCFVLFCLASGYGLRATSSAEFCVSCHEMEEQAGELKASSHAKDKDGLAIGCAQCHIPVGIGPRYLSVKLYLGVKDLAAHAFMAEGAGIDRMAAQPAARRFASDDNCLACHADLYKNAKGDEAVSAIGKLAHDAYLGRNGNTRSNCAGCHVNIAHLPEFDRWLEIRRDFALRLAATATEEGGARP